MTESVQPIGGFATEVAREVFASTCSSASEISGEGSTISCENSNEANLYSSLCTYSGSNGVVAGTSEDGLLTPATLSLLEDGLLTPITLPLPEDGLLSEEAPEIHSQSPQTRGEDVVSPLTSISNEDVLDCLEQGQSVPALVSISMANVLSPLRAYFVGGIAEEEPRGEE